MDSLLPNRTHDRWPDPPGGFDLHCGHRFATSLRTHASWAAPGKKKTDRTSRHTQVGVSHSTPAHRGGHVQKRIWRRQARGAKSDPVRRRSNHAWTDDQAGKRRCANTDTVGGWRVHTACDTPSMNAATRPMHCNFMCQGDIWPRAAAGSSRNGTTQAVAITHKITIRLRVGAQNVITSV